MAPQITRLAIAFGLLIAGFLAVRSQAVPEDFGSEGFHRADVHTILAKQDPKHAGQNACFDCHSDKAELSPHSIAGISCESCHGPSRIHAEDFEAYKPPVPASRAFCVRCHADVTGRSSVVPQIDPKEHNPANTCVDCHQVHPSEEQP